MYDTRRKKPRKAAPAGQAVASGWILSGFWDSVLFIGAPVTCILALFPLALEGGPLWQPLCYAQIGGLAVATFITLLLVPVFYAIFVLDLKLIKWETVHVRDVGDQTEHPAA